MLRNTPDFEGKHWQKRGQALRAAQWAKCAEHAGWPASGQPGQCSLQCRGENMPPTHPPTTGPLWSRSAAPTCGSWCAAAWAATSSTTAHIAISAAIRQRRDEARVFSTGSVTGSIPGSTDLKCLSPSCQRRRNLRTLRGAAPRRRWRSRAGSGRPWRSSGWSQPPAARIAPAAARACTSWLEQRPPALAVTSAASVIADGCCSVDR